MKTALTIGGSDSSGGAGIEADLKTFTVLHVFGLTSITAVTAQNTLGIKATAEISPDIVRQQIQTVAGDIQVDACKTGMLCSAATIDAVADAIKQANLQPYVCDPTLVTRTGEALLNPDAIDILRRKLFPLATVITPNLREAAKLTGLDEQALKSIPAAKDAAKRLVADGAKAVVIKGLESADQTVDLFFDGKEFLEFAQPTLPKEKTHGSGSVFSAAITAGLANRLNLVDAIDQAKQVVTMAIQYSDGQGRGTAPVNVLAFAPKKK
jgi:hydroxymethylpyrimidine/phosphomethylpyrimidine kinase